MSQFGKWRRTCKFVLKKQVFPTFFNPIGFWESVVEVVEIERVVDEVVEDKVVGDAFVVVEVEDEVVEDKVVGIGDKVVEEWFVVEIEDEVVDKVVGVEGELVIFCFLGLSFCCDPLGELVGVDGELVRVVALVGVVSFALLPKRFLFVGVIHVGETLIDICSSFSFILAIK